MSNLMKLFQTNLNMLFKLVLCLCTAVTEGQIEGGIVGPLFANILADGFSRLRDGDRFYFESLSSGLTLGKHLMMSPGVDEDMTSSHC